MKMTLADFASRRRPKWLTMSRLCRAVVAERLFQKRAIGLTDEIAVGFLNGEDF